MRTSFDSLTYLPVGNRSHTIRQYSAAVSTDVVQRLCIKKNVNQTKLELDNQLD